MDKTEKKYRLPLRQKKWHKERIFEIDFLRGFDIFLMILCHFCYDISDWGLKDFMNAPAKIPDWIKNGSEFGKMIFFSITNPTGYSFNNTATILLPLEVIFAGLFVFLCGVSCSFSKSNFHRGIKLAYIALAITFFFHIANFYFKTGAEIYLGILHSIAIALLVYSLFDYLFPKWWQTYLFAIGLVLLSGITLYYAFATGSGPLTCEKGDSIFLLFVGMRRIGVDYFSPLPITAILFLGAVVGKTLYRERKPLTPKWFPKKWARPFLFLGRYSLEAYLFHQPILYLFLFIVLTPFGYTLKI